MTDRPADRHKRGMRGAYDEAAERYARHIEPSFTPISARLLALAAPRADERHLDLATGTGLLLGLAARGPDTRGSAPTPAGSPIGLDLSAAMLRHARAAAPATRCVQGDLERLPLRDATVDVATLSLALHHLPTPRAALAEARRVLRRGGRLAIAAWTTDLSALWRAFDAWFEQAGLGESRTVQRDDGALNTPERLRAALADAGFESLDVTAERPPLPFPDLDAFWEWRVSFPATHRVVGALPADERDRRRASCLDALAPLAAFGPVRADQGVMFALAR